MGDVVLNTIVFSLLSSLPSLFLGFLFSWTLQRFDWPPRLRRAIELALKTPYLLPPFFLAMGWMLISLRFGEFYGIPFASAVMALWSIAAAMIHFQAFFAQMPGSIEDAGLICGASPWKVFRTITVPLAKRHLLSGFALLFLNALAAFGVPALLATPGREHVLTTKIYQNIKSNGDFAAASKTSLILLFIAAALSLLNWITSRKAPHARLVTGKSGASSKLRGGFNDRLILCTAVLVACFGSIFPFTAILILSLLKDPTDFSSFSVDRYVTVLFRMPEVQLSIVNSFISGLSAALIATAIAFLMAYSIVRRPSRWLELSARALDAFANLTQAIPGTILALGFLVFFAGTLTDTLWILGLSYLTKYLAFATRSLIPAMSGLAPELEEAAALCGATRRKVLLSIVLPLLRPALSAALFLSFVPMVSELTMSILLSGAGTETLGTLLYRFLDYADPGSASVVAVLLSTGIFSGNLVLRKLSKERFGI